MASACPSPPPGTSGSSVSSHSLEKEERRRQYQLNEKLALPATSAPNNPGSPIILKDLPSPSPKSPHSETPDSSNTTRDPESLQDGSATPSLPEAAPEAEAEAEKNFKPKTLRFWLVILSNFVALFLVALDRTIIATAIPRITDDFGSLGDIGWYGSSYMLATAASQLLFGRIYKFYSLRWVYLGSITVFELGSLLCGAAPNSTTLIAGRAIAGFGSAGIFTGSIMVMIPMIPLRKRPLFQSIFGMVFGISSVIGPLVGGGFTGTVSWRWCFYMNLPIGGVALLFLFFMLKVRPRPNKPTPWVRHITRLDPLGAFFFIPSIVSLLLALQWGGSTYAWNDARIIALFIIFGTAILAFAAVQILLPDTAQVPVRIITQRTMLAGAFYMFFLAGAMMMAVFYVPLWFQTVKGVDPVTSGIYVLPLVLSLVASSFISGGMTQKLGYYVPSMLICPCIMSVGLGLMSTFQKSSSTGHWVGYQFLTGFGLGFGMQTVSLAVQTVLPHEDVSTGIAISFFAQQLGGAIFLSVGQTILSNRLVSNLSGLTGLGLDAGNIVMSGATDLHDIVPARYFDDVVQAYNYACTRIFLAGMSLALACLLCALFVQWRSIKKKPMDTQGGSSADPTRADEKPANSP